MALEEEEPVSPASRLWHAPGHNLSILMVLGFASSIDIIEFNKCVEQTLLKHPRFTSIMVVKDEMRLKCSWKPTMVNLNNHIIVPSLDSEMESPNKFVEDYTARVANTPFDLSKPLWEVHVLQIKTADANSTVLFKIHHSMGDGVSIISLLIACARKKSDPGSLPAFPSKKKQGPPKGFLVTRMFFLVLKSILTIYYTMLDVILLFATNIFMKDAENPIKRPPGTEHSATRYVHRIMKLDDVKIIKNAMKTTINNVLLGATEDGLCKYLENRYDTQRANGIILPKTEDIINKQRIRINVFFNLRPEPSIKELPEVLAKREKLANVKWGNILGTANVPLMMFDDSLNCVRSAKDIMDKRKISFGPKLQYLISNLVVRVFGVKVASEMFRRQASNTTTTISNVFGPEEEIILFGHPLNYIAITVSGSPQALAIHFLTYATKLIICVAADEKLIPDPHDLCEYIHTSIENMKDLVIKRGLISDSN